MVQPRAGHTATLLTSGKVLIIDGGQLDIDDLLVSTASAEMFDPSNGSFVATGTPHVAREFHSATLLQNGEVLIAGGNEFNGYPTWLTPSATAELYDPGAGRFAMTGSMAVGRAYHTANLLPGGRVLVVGGASQLSLGSNASQSAVANGEIYDPANGTFTSTGNMSSPREGHTATVLPSGKVLIIGGQNDQNALATAELYDPATNSFTPTGSMSMARVGHTATLLPNGKVLVVGGATVPALGIGQMIIGITGQTSGELYDPSTGSFEPAASMNTGRIGHSATLLGDGTVLVAGGFNDWVNGVPVSVGYESYETAEIYDPVANTFTAIESMNTGRFWHSATPLTDGRVLFAGGIGGADSALSSSEIFK